jgi:hypothetical protein
LLANFFGDLRSKEIMILLMFDHCRVFDSVELLLQLAQVSIRRVKPTPALVNGEGGIPREFLFHSHLNGGLVCAYFRPNCMPRHTSHIVRHHKPTLNERRAGWISLALYLVSEQL